MKCFACGGEIHEDARFCPYCGQKQQAQPEQVLCAHCNQPLEAGAKFCGFCGGDQSAAPEAVPVEQETVPAQEEVAAEPETEKVEVVEEVAEEAPVEEEIPAQPQPEPVFHQPVYEAQPVVNIPVQPVVQSVFYPAPPVRPAFQLPHRRALWKMILLSILTCGIYPMVIWCKMSMEINVVAGRHDGKWTMHFLCMAMLAPLTLGIYPLVWIHELCNRIGDELIRRQVGYKFSAATFWVWNLLYPVLGSVVCGIAALVLAKAGVDELVMGLVVIGLAVASGVGPFVYLHKHMKAMNLMNMDYNEKG